METDQIIIQRDTEEKEKMYKQHLMHEAEQHAIDQQLENCKRITIQRNKEKQKEQERNNRLNNFWNAITEFMTE